MQHVIQYQTFDVEFSDAGKSYDLQNKISDIFNNQLLAGMEQLFNRLVPQDTTLTLNEVNIDLGNINYNLLEYDLVGRVLSELEKEIKYQLAIRHNGASETQTEDEQIKSLKGSYTDLLEYFLLTGAMPWWATGELMIDPANAIGYLLIEDAAGLKKLIINTGQQGYVRQRLVHQFSEQIIHGVINLLEPAQATFIFDYHATVVKNQREEQLIENAISHDFEKDLWVFILTYILVDRGSLFNQKSFVKSTLAQIASHYNRSYTELLTLMTMALNSDQLHAKQNSQLPTIIEELFLEESDNRDISANNDDGFKDDAIVKQNIELIKQYLVFGSLPWWAPPYTMGNMVDVFLGLIKTVPKTLNKLITTIGQNEEIRKRIITVFDDEAITAIVRLLEPGHTTFIINYVAEVQQLHTKRVIVSADGRAFKKTVWKFVVDFLLLERGSVFNERMFLQSNIRMLANNYNVQYLDMLGYFVQSISQLHQDSVGHAPLFKLLAGLLNDLDQQSVQSPQQHVPLKKQTDKPRANDTENASQNIVLKDVLLHWLTYGNIPWWGKAYFEWSAQVMMEALLSAAPSDAALLLKFAGTKSNMQQRVIYQFSSQLIINILKLYPKGDEAIEVYQYLLAAIVSVKGGKQLSQSELDQLLLLTAWNTFIGEQYIKFNTVVFVQDVVYQLTEQYQIKAPVILNAVKEVLNVDKKYSKILNELSQPVNHSNSKWMLLDEKIETTDFNQVINQHLTEKGITGNRAIFEEALYILDYYLLNNKLPQQFKGTNPAYVNAMVKQLLSFLNTADDFLLKQKLESAGKMHLYKLIGSNQPNAQINQGIEQIISNYLHYDDSVQTEDTINEALRVLEYFLTNGQLPEYLRTVNIKAILKQLLILLSYEKPSALNSLLQKSGHVPDARMLLHNIFATTDNTAENNVSHVLKVYFEADALLYVSQLHGIVSTADEKLTDLMIVYLQHPKDHAQFIMAILKQPAMARYIALNYTDELVCDLLSNGSSFISGAQNLVWLKQLQQLLNLAFTDTLSRDQFNILFREFNLLVLGGHLIVKNTDAYLRALFSFVSAANYSLFVTLSDVLLKPKSEMSHTLEKQFPEVVHKLHKQQKSNSTKLAVHQLLNSTNDHALQQITGLQTDKQKSTEAKQLNNELADAVENKKNKNPLMNNKDTVYINNAGLVLLNPFLSTYFVRLGIMEKGEFINTDSQLRAVHLLQYLVNGAQQSAEHELVLNKIFCNVPIEHAVPPGITLTDDEKAVSVQLLNTVLARWDKLKNTSIEGLQTSFLQRKGALFFDDDAWHLRVEQRAYDVLLQSLPWTIGMIKTPWMDNFLYVEWI